MLYIQIDTKKYILFSCFESINLVVTLTTQIFVRVVKVWKELQTKMDQLSTRGLEERQYHGRRRRSDRQVAWILRKQVCMVFLNLKEVHQLIIDSKY